ncbi:MAG: hypothetical protein C0614_07770 [Desulfuromonas sp.]|nr:MAG: hypothetical protein C0614_07770 [Desulfuromonas sp.]
MNGVRRLVGLTVISVFFYGVNLLWAADSTQPLGGVGLQVVPTVDGELVVLRVVEAGSAARRGLLPGDLIYQVDDFPLTGSDFAKVVAEHLWGPVGSRLMVHFRRPGVAGPLSATLERTLFDRKLTVTPTAGWPTESGKGRD